MSYLILMPYTHRTSAEKCLATMSPEVCARVHAVDNTVDNTGAAASYNIGARRILTEGIDWLITLSPSTRFGPPGGADFVAYLDAHPDAWVVEAEVPVGWHWIAWHHRMFERVGLWDENFWPVYGEDIDISHRILTAIAEDAPDPSPWHVFACDAWLTMQGYSSHLGGINTAITLETRAYYERKWGGWSGHETYSRPFGADYPLSYWPPPTGDPSR